MSNKLIDPQNWDEYWSKKKSKKIYDFIAYYYRNLLIRRTLDFHINKMKESIKNCEKALESIKINNIDLTQEQLLTLYLTLPFITR